MNFLDRRQRVSTCTLRRTAVYTMATALGCVFFTTPFQAAASFCALPDLYELVECCGSEATAVNASLMSQRETPYEHKQGRLQLRLKVSYSAGAGYGFTERACAKLSMTVRLGESRVTYGRTLYGQPGVPQHIEYSPRFLFVPPFRQSDVYVESVSCKMPKLLMGGNRSCGSDGEKERELAEKLALAEERERRALEEERQRMNQERERLAQQREEQERVAQQQLREEQDEFRREQDEVDQRKKEYELQRIAQLQADHQHQPSQGEAGDASGLQQFLTGFQSGMAIVQGLGNLLGVGANIPSSIGQGAASGSISEACHQAEVRIADRLQRLTFEDEGMCTTYRTAAQMAGGAKRELQSAGCPASHLREMDQFIAAARRNAQSVCVD